MSSIDRAGNVNEDQCGVQERRDTERSDVFHQVSLIGNYGTFEASLLNLSYKGALINIKKTDLGLPDDWETTDLLTQTIEDQFKGGLVLQVTGTDLKVEANIMRAAFNPDKSGVEVGCKFRRHLSHEECICLQLTPPPPVITQTEVAQVVEQTFELNFPETDDAPSIRELLVKAANRGATDFHVKVGNTVRVRVAGRLTNLGDEVITQERAQRLAMDLMNPEQANRFLLEGDLELTTNIEDKGRFRVNAFRQQGCTGLAIRCIPNKIPTIEQLELPSVVSALAEKPNGLVLVTGAAGSGKSTTLAAMINHINQTRSCNIVTLEDPVEYLHTDIKANVNQREIGFDVPDFSSALKRALRQDPDVIMIGEMRDMETIALTVTAAETGHLVLATLHTNSAMTTPGRIIDAFPPDQQEQIRIQLSESLQGIVSQFLLPSTQGGLVVATETLVATDAIRALIRDKKTMQIANLQQTGSSDGMHTMESSLLSLVDRGLISEETALARIKNPQKIKNRK